MEKQQAPGDADKRGETSEKGGKDKFRDILDEVERISGHGFSKDLK